MRTGAGSAAKATEPKPLRRDAELNLTRILAAAHEVFAEYGYEASMEQVACRAGVGVGTLYRRFPTKADLCTAVVDAASERMRQIALEILRDGVPADGAFDFVRRCVAEKSSWRAATSRRPWIGGGADRALAALLPLVGRILLASQQAGTVRPDVVPADLVVILMSVRSVGDLCDADAPGTSTRFLEVALDGLRPGGAALVQPPITVKQLGQVLTDR